jgi:hypothetical protein
MQRNDGRHLGRRGRLGLLALAAAGSIMVGVSPGMARDAFVAGGSATVASTLDEAGQRSALDRAARVGRALGLPDGARRAVARIDDRFEVSVVDEVTTYDAAGRPLAIVRSTPEGRLRTVVRLGWSTARGHLGQSAAMDRASSLLDAAGIRPIGVGHAIADRTGNGWTVAWPRLLDGVPVRGDGTWVRLWSDGSLHSVATAEAPLAAVPSTTLDADAARRLADAQVAAWSEGVSPVGTVSTIELAWVAPNDLFEPSRPDAPEPVRRLAWVARVTPQGTLASRLRAIELYIDAGDGRLLGGDLLE